MMKFEKNISNEQLAALPAGHFGQRIVVVDSIEHVDAACDDLLSQTHIGFDTETRPSFTAGVINKVALLQLSTETCCYLFRLNNMRLDKSIIKVLESPAVVKVGAAIRDDIKALKVLRHFKHNAFIDLQSIVGGYGIAELSVRKMAAITLGIRISKAQRLSNWEAKDLTEAQQSYAATDAWVSLMIYKKLSNVK